MLIPKKSSIEYTAVENIVFFKASDYIDVSAGNFSCKGKQFGISLMGEDRKLILKNDSETDIDVTITESGL